MTSVEPDLVLGTAQFGLDYGVTNSLGQVDEAEVRNLLQVFYNAGGRWLDTAPAYGDAECVLGKTGVEHFNIISKTHVFDFNRYEGDFVTDLNKTLKQTLQSLQVDSIAVLLLHQEELLLLPESEKIVQWLLAVKAQGLTSRIGVSVYNPDVLSDSVLEKIDWIQLPCNPLDHTFLHSGLAERCKKFGVFVQGRSFFLQGILLNNKVPDWLKEKDISTALNHFFQYAQRTGITKEALCLLMSRYAQIHYATIGVTSRQELNELLTTWQEMLSMNLVDMSGFATPSKYVSPANWECR